MRHPVRVTGAAALTLAALTLAAAGCTSSEASSDGIPTYAEVSEISRTMWQQQEAATAECMSDAGFTYYPREFAERNAAQPLAGTDPDNRLYDIQMDLGYVSEHGFGYTDSLLDSGKPETEAADRNTEYAETLSDSEYLAYERALSGEDGCRSRAEAAVRDELGPQLRALDQTAATLFDVITNDPDFQEIDRAWAACMAEAGWQTDSVIAFPEEIMDQAFARMSEAERPEEEDPETPQGAISEKLAAEMSEFEIRAATDMVECWQPHAEEYRSILDRAYGQVGSGQ